MVLGGRFRGRCAIDRQNAKIVRASHGRRFSPQNTKKFPPVDFDAIPLVRPLAAAFGLVCAVTRGGDLLDERSLRGDSHPLSVAVHKNISPDVMVAGFLATLDGDFIICTRDHSSVTEDTHLHVA